MLCVFDVNETLLDLATFDDFFTEVTGDPAARREWFDLVIHNALVLTAAHGYRPFGEIAGAALAPVAAAHGRKITPEHQRELGDRLRRLPAHPEVRESIERLRDAGFATVTLTNSVGDVAEDQLRNSGLRDLIDTSYSADQVRRLKPAPEPYRFVLDDQQVAPSGAVMIAAHGWDIAGASAAGMVTAFITRDEHIPLPAADAPSITGTNLDDVATQIIARYAGQP